MIYLRRFWPLGLVILLSVFTVFPLFHSGFFSMHDDVQVARVYEMGKSLKDGVFPVRWVADLGYGYGYPEFNFYSPFAYYMGGFLVLLGVNALLATKIVFIFALLFSAVAMYWLIKNFVGEIIGILCGVLYVYFPYHAVNAYVRGDLDELLAYALLPMVFLGMFKVFQMSNTTNVNPPAGGRRSNDNKKKFGFVFNSWGCILLASISITLVAVTHNLTFFMLLLFLGLYCLVTFLISKNKTTLFINYAIIFVVAFLLSAFYTVPAISEMKYTNVLSQLGGGAQYFNNFVCPSQLWNSPWGYGGSIPGCYDGLSFRLGKVNIILFVASIFILLAFSFGNHLPFFKEKYKVFSIKYFAKIQNTFFFLSIVFGLLSLFMLTQYSSFIWRIIPDMAFLQYPWRFLNFAGLFMVMGIGFGMGYGREILESKFTYEKIWRKFAAFNPHLNSDFIGIRPLHKGEELITKGILVIISGVIIVATLFTSAKLFIPQTYYSNRTATDYTNKNYLNWTASKISDEYMPKNFIKPKNLSQIPHSFVQIIHGIGLSGFETVKTGDLSAKLFLAWKSQIKLNIASFPAWDVFLDGKKVNYQNTSQGLVIPISFGYHTIEAKYEQTPIEIFSDVLSLIGVLILIVFTVQYSRKVIS